MPELARQLLTRVNVHAPALPAPTLTATDLRSLGRYDWWAYDKVSNEQQQQIQSLAEREPLAGMLYLLHTPQKNARVGEAAYRRIFSQEPANLEARAECIKIWRYLSPTMQGEIFRSMPILPNNYIVTTWKFMNPHTPQDMIRCVEHMVQCAPHDPIAWTSLAGEYGSIADLLRAGRVASDLTPSEWKVLTRLCTHQLSAAQHAASVDPELGRVWYGVAVAATFAGNPTVADDALWKAIRLDKGNARVYLWGLEMYQPKWFGDTVKLDKMVKMTMADHTIPPNGLYELATVLQKLGRITEAQALEVQAKAGNQTRR